MVACGKFFRTISILFPAGCRTVFPKNGNFYNASIRSLSLRRAFLRCFFNISSAISQCGTAIEQHYSGGSEAREEGTQGGNEITKKTLKTILSAVGLFDLWKLLNLAIKLLFVLHGFSTTMSSIKNKLKIIFLKNTLLFHINIKFFQNLKKKLNSVGTLPMDWFYEEK